METIRIGIVGCGYWGPNLIRNFVELPGSEVAAVADLRESRLRHVRSKYPGIQTTRDYRELFKMDLDAAVVVTQPASHFAIARDFLQHGLGVLLEKPLTLCSRDAEELIELATRRGLCLMTGHTLEYNPAVRALKDLIQQGVVGRVLHISSVRTNSDLLQREVDVLWDLAPHDVSMLLYLLGQEPVSVSATAGSYLHPDLLDVVHLNIRYADGTTAHVHVSWIKPCKTRRLTVVGSNKTVVFDDVSPDQKIKIYEMRDHPQSKARSGGELSRSNHNEDPVIPDVELVEPLRLECEDFLRSVASGEEPQCGGQSGLRVVKILEAANRSLNNGGVFELVMPMERFVDEPARI